MQRQAHRASVCECSCAASTKTSLGSEKHKRHNRGGFDSVDKVAPPFCRNGNLVRVENHNE